LALIGMKLALNALSGEQEQPDVPNASCCGEADAYWVDEIHVRDSKTCVTNTDDRADEPRGRPHVGVAFPGAASSAMRRLNYPVGACGQALGRALVPRLSSGTLQLSIRCSSIHFRPRRSLPVSGGVRIAVVGAT
jgi:hypothetical protein